MPEDKFKEWAILELFGHKRLAGEVSEATIGGGAFIRIDIPSKDGSVTTEYYSPQAIYGIHPATEETARAVAAYCEPAPISRWDIQCAIKRLQQGAGPFEPSGPFTFIEDDGDDPAE